MDAAAKRTAEYFQKHTIRWVKPDPAITPLEVQFELFTKKHKGIRKIPPNEDSLNGFLLLPLDVLHIILWHTDLQTLTNFRLINRYSLSIVESAPAYKLIEKHAAKAYRACLMIQSASFITLGHFINTIKTEKCYMEECNNFAPYIYLVTCIRVCETCVKEDINLFPLPIYHAVCLFGLGKAALLDIPHMLPWKGICKQTGKRIGAPVLVDYREALAAGLRKHGSEEAMKKRGSQIFPEPDLVGPLIGENIIYGWREHRYQAGYKKDGRRRRRWLAICGVPCVSRLGEVPEERRICRTCDDRLLYSRDEFADHVDKIDAAESESQKAQQLALQHASDQK